MLRYIAFKAMKSFANNKTKQKDKKLIIRNSEIRVEHTKIPYLKE